MAHNNHLSAAALCELIANAEPIEGCPSHQALGLIIVARNAPAELLHCLEYVFRTYHAARCRGLLWIVVIAGPCDHGVAVTARQAVGAFGQVIQVQAESTHASSLIGQRLVADHFAAHPASAVITRTIDVT